VSNASGDIERQDTHVMVLPYAGVFAKHESRGKHVVGTPCHAGFIAADSPPRPTFPGAISDRAMVLRFDEALAPEKRDTIPGAREVIAIDDARLFFPDDRLDALAANAAFWDVFASSE
jgi:hypothetical protein